MAVMAASLTSQRGDATDDDLLARARAGDAAAFAGLVRRYNPSLVRVARLYVSGDASAADVAQDTWIAVLNGLDRFEGRASFKTWLFRILVNQARKNGAREARQAPHAATTTLSEDPYDGAVDRARLKPATDPVEPRHWISVPQRWDLLPEQQSLTGELRENLEAAIDSLSPAQKEVITLRDVLGWAANEVADALGITETNQRVLLHRARAGVRNRLEEYLTQ